MKQTPSLTFNDTLILFFTTSVLSIGVIFFYSLATRSPIFSLDDAYIVLHNAQVLHTGYDQNYSHTSALFGATSAVHLLLTYLFTFWVSAPTSLFMISAIAFIAYVCGLLRLAFLFKASLLQTMVFIITALTIFYTPFHFINGLETGLVLAASTWLLCMACMTHTSFVRKTLLPCFGGLVTFIRPELGLLAILIILLQGWRGWRYLAHQSTCFFIFVLPWMAWYEITTGHPLPQTLVAKVVFYGYTHFPIAYRLNVALHNTLKFAIIFGYYLGFCGALALLFINKLGRILLLFLLIFWCTYAFYFYGGLSPDFNLGRYWAPCLPLLFFGILSGLHHEDKTLCMAANTLLFTLCFTTLFPLYSNLSTYIHVRQLSFNAYKNTTEWCRINIPTNSKLMIHDAGYIAYASSFGLIDLVGLKTPENTFYYKNRSNIEGLKHIIYHHHPHYFILAQYWNQSYSKQSMIKDLQDTRYQLTLLRKGEYELDYDVYKISYL